MTRRALALLVLTGWGALAVAYGRREMRRTAEVLRSDLRSKVAPGVHWFAVEQHGDHCGFASLALDTLALGQVQLRWRMVHRCGAGRWEEEIPVRTSASLALREVDFRLVCGNDTVRGRARMGSYPGRLEGTVNSTARGRLPLVFGDSATVRSLALLRLALRSELRPGAELRPALLGSDGRLVRAIYSVGNDSMFAVVDSAAKDAAGDWRAARSDTIRAWRVTEREEGDTAVFWVDRGGRIVLARLDSGLVLRRTAFELAFENWRRIAGRAAGGPLGGRECRERRSSGTVQRK
ncbi:MAG TPA: hypothetical protein VNL96_09895 [Gemmatimonadaceae bacterium]|nr:hypothetical protein [Gemmatimonadaceae bacterium]